jgi:hypothetical protein
MLSAENLRVPRVCTFCRLLRKWRTASWTLLSKGPVGHQTSSVTEVRGPATQHRVEPVGGVISCRWKNRQIAIRLPEILSSRITLTTSSSVKSGSSSMSASKSQSASQAATCFHRAVLRHTGRPRESTSPKCVADNVRVLLRYNISRRAT